MTFLDKFLIHELQNTVHWRGLETYSIQQKVRSEKSSKQWYKYTLYTKNIAIA